MFINLNLYWILELCKVASNAKLHTKFIIVHLSKFTIVVKIEEEGFFVGIVFNNYLYIK